MSYVAAAMVIGGAIIKGVGQYRANLAQADAEERNASFYREEADFARKTGDRQRLIFDRESAILYGRQEVGFAKAGMDAMDSSKFMGQQHIFREQESQAIQDEADFNVRLATLRAEHSMENARQLRSGSNNAMQFGGNMLQGASSIL